MYEDIYYPGISDSDREMNRLHNGNLMTDSQIQSSSPLTPCRALHRLSPPERHVPRRRRPDYL